MRAPEACYIQSVLCPVFPHFVHLGDRLDGFIALYLCGLQARRFALENFYLPFRNVEQIHVFRRLCFLLVQIIDHESLAFLIFPYPKTVVTIILHGRFLDFTYLSSNALFITFCRNPSDLS
jgi:hypothetical protein